MQYRTLWTPAFVVVLEMAWPASPSSAQTPVAAGVQLARVSAPRPVVPSAVGPAAPRAPRAPVWRLVGGGILGGIVGTGAGVLTSAVSVGGCAGEGCGWTTAATLILTGEALGVSGGRAGGQCWAKSV